MASIFLSYDRADVDRARPLAAALEKAGHSVWWDRHIKSGAQYSKEIEAALKKADAVVVLWSERSVESAWVRDEAADGRDTGRLVPVLIDGTPAPLGFRQYQATEMSRWRGSFNAPAFQEILGAIEALGGGPAAEPFETVPKLAIRRPRFGIILALFAAAVLIAGLAIWRPWTNQSTVPVVAIAAATQAPQARGLARDLLAKLGNLHATQTEALRLIHGDDAGSKANLILEVDGSTRGPDATANLILLGGKNRALLWSKDFEQPLVKQGDLNQQLAYTAAKVLECAVEALTSKGARMREETLKLYLNGCSAFSEQATADPRPLVPIFRAVVEKAPRFEGAWAKLINAEAEVVTSIDWEADAQKFKPHLLRHLAEARKLNPDMAAVLIADANLIPSGAFRRRMELLERAVERNPESPQAVAAYSSNLMTVGRTAESIDAARRTVLLDPLSPASRDILISALTYAGATDAALEELRKAELLWPGASNLLAARYRVHLRYGDPLEAQRIQRLGEFGGPHRDAFLRARIGPSPANIEKAIALPRAWHRQDQRAIAELAQVLGAFGKEEELFSILLNERLPNDVSWITDVLFRPALRNVRRDPRMIAVAKRIGLLDYWQTSGKWPDFCREPDLPYDCKAEAAKLARPT